jgi:hypothetical protein
MVNNQPGYTRANQPAWPEWDDDRNLAKSTIPVIKELPVIVAVDGGLTGRAVFMQERGDGQLRILRETSIEPCGMKVLGGRILAIQALPEFERCQFVYVCDPSMIAGEDTEGEISERAALARRSASRSTTFSRRRRKCRTRGATRSARSSATTARTASRA